MIKVPLGPARGLPIISEELDSIDATTFIVGGGGVPVAVASTNIIGSSALVIAAIGAIVHYRLGESPVATQNDPVVFSNTNRVVGCQPGEKISFIKDIDSGDGRVIAHALKETLF